ncbi:MAG: acetyl-CoA hydrolase/transferase C-terminal domain-containing protein [Acidobacteriota bacterium]
MSDQEQVLEALEARLRPGATVFCSGGLAEPSGLLELLSAHSELARDVRLVLIRPPGVQLAEIDLPNTTVVCFFQPADLEAGRNVGAIEFLPKQYSQICRYLSETDFDLALGQFGPRADETLSYSLCADFLPLLVDRGVPLIAEVNALLPASIGAASLDRDRCIGILDSRREPARLESASTATAEAIGAQVATLVSDGDCVETGIGSIPDAVLRALQEKNDLGIHSGMISDGVAELVERGVVTGACKTIDRGRVVTGFALGSTGLYEWASSDPAVSFRDVSYTHDTSVLGQIDNFKAVNSAIEVDLFGQVNAETVRGRQLSGIGGALDFMRGAARSRGGTSVVALPATAAKGKVSRIVPRFAPGNLATAARSELDAVATEYGVAQVRDLSVADRARALAEIAAPEFRDELRAAAAEL